LKEATCRVNLSDSTFSLALENSECYKSSSSIFQQLFKFADLLTKKTDTDFSEVMNSASKNSELVSDIALASAEQAQGICESVEEYYQRKSDIKFVLTIDCLQNRILC